MGVVIATHYSMEKAAIESRLKCNNTKKINEFSISSQAKIKCQVVIKEAIRNILIEFIASLSNL